MAKPCIKKPQGIHIHTTSPCGAVSMRLAWAPDFAQRRTSQFERTQRAIDSEVLRYSSAYVPKRTGRLDASGRAGTVLGTGEVHYSAPYAWQQYYDSAPTRSYDAKRGCRWFETMKLRHKTAIERTAKAKAGAK